jgi:hypothetical protein
MSHRRFTWWVVWPWLILALVLLGSIYSCNSAPAPAPARNPAPTGETARLAGAVAATEPPTEAPTATADPTATPVPPMFRRGSTQAPTAIPQSDSLRPTAMPAPTQTSTPEPTATPVPTQTPTPAPSASAIASPTGTSTPAATATPDFAALTVKTAVLNLRSGPGTAYPVIGRVREGETYRIKGKNERGDWWQIAVKDQDGWVSGDLVSVAGPLQGVAVVQVAPPPTAAPQMAAAASFTGARPPFGYGIQVTSWDTAGSISAIRDLGFNWVKVQIPWKDLEGSPGAIDWGGLDSMVAQFNGAGIKFLASVPKAPNWARPQNSDMGVEGPPADPNTYARFVGQMAGRYCGRINAIEVWNEQNMNYEWGNEPADPARYVRLLAAAYQAIKAACPQTTVVSGALTPAGNVTIAGQWRAIDDFDYLRAMYQNGLARWSDAIGVHPSGYNLSPDTSAEQGCAFISQKGASFRGACDSPHHSWSFFSTMRGYYNIMAQYGDGNKQLWPTEFGWASGWSGKPGYEYANDNSADEQAQWTVRAYQLMRSWGFVGPAFLWNLNFTDSDGGQWHISGRPAYDALKNMPK